MLYVPRKQLTNTPESPETEHIEEAKYLPFMIVARENSVYQLKRKGRGYIHWEPYSCEVPKKKENFESLKICFSESLKIENKKKDFTPTAAFSYMVFVAVIH